MCSSTTKQTLDFNKSIKGSTSTTRNGFFHHLRQLQCNIHWMPPLRYPTLATIGKGLLRSLASLNKQEPMACAMTFTVVRITLKNLDNKNCPKKNMPSWQNTKAFRGQVLKKYSSSTLVLDVFLKYAFGKKKLPSAQSSLRNVTKLQFVAP